MAQRKRSKELTGEEPMGSERIPYDRTDPMEAIQGLPTGPEGGAGGPDLGGLGMQAATQPGLGSLGELGMDQGAAGVPPDMGADPLALGADAGLAGEGDADLAALGQPLDGMMSPEDQEVEQLAAALDDPNTPPMIRQQIEQELQLAARRRLGQMGQGGGPGLAA